MVIRPKRKNDIMCFSIEDRNESGWCNMLTYFLQNPFFSGIAELGYLRHIQCINRLIGGLTFGNNMADIIA